MFVVALFRLLVLCLGIVFVRTELLWVWVQGTKSVHGVIGMLVLTVGGGEGVI